MCREKKKMNAYPGWRDRWMKKRECIQNKKTEGAGVEMLEKKRDRL